jgi:galactokinase
MGDEQFINVFPDTQSFDSNQMDFANKTLEVLRWNVAARHIHIFSTAVTQREAERHVSERAAKAQVKLETLRDDSLLRHVKQAQLDAFHAIPVAKDIRNAMFSQVDILTQADVGSLHLFATPLRVSLQKPGAPVTSTAVRRSDAPCLRFGGYTRRAEYQR